MRALVCSEHGVRLQDHPDPKAARGEVVLDVRVAGICNTDLEIAKGYMSFSGVLGHEVLGDIIDVGPETVLPAHLQGTRVVTEINCSCLSCPTCLGGARTHCPTREVLGILGRDGELAERVAVPIANLHAVPASLSDEHAVFAEPLAAAMHAFDEAAPRPGARVLLLGDGKLGLLIGMALAMRAGDLGQALVIGRHTDKLALLERLGLDVCLEADFDDKGFDLVVEATGQPSGLARALEAVRPRGTLILKSTYAGQAQVDLSPVVVNEINVLGSRCGPFPRAIDALAKGGIDPSGLITEHYPLADAEHAFRRAADPDVLKVLIRRE